MGLLDRLFNRISIPKFSVSVYGKLPCHKEYLQVGGVPGFLQLRQILDRGFEARISSNLPRPHVLPDRRLYVAVDEKTHLVGCIFESDDGIRAFPFLMVAPFPAKLTRLSPASFWQCLDQFWMYLEAYFEDLGRQPTADAFYNRVRGVVHELPSFTPVTWSSTAQEEPERYSSLLRVRLTPDMSPDWIIPYAPAVNPQYVLCPASHWTRQVKEETWALFGRYGLEDIEVEQFRQAIEATQPTTNPDESFRPEVVPLNPSPIRPTEQPEAIPRPIPILSAPLPQSNAAALSAVHPTPDPPPDQNPPVGEREQLNSNPLDVGPSRPTLESPLSGGLPERTDSNIPPELLPRRPLPLPGTSPLTQSGPIQLTLEGSNGPAKTPTLPPQPSLLDPPARHRKETGPLQSADALAIPAAMAPPLPMNKKGTDQDPPGNHRHPF